MAKQAPMTLMQFLKQFSTEEACHQHLFQMKWPEGFVCPKCQHTQAYVIKTRRLPLYECMSCRHQTTVTVDTIFEKTRTPLQKWFHAIYLVSQDKRGVSATLLAKELEISYPTAWTMLHKIRKAMSERDARYFLSGKVELDDMYIGSPTEGGKRGRGTDKNQVLVSLSLDSKGRPEFLKMKLVTDMKSQTVVDFAKSAIQQGSTVICDGYRSFGILEEKGYPIDSMKFDPKNKPDHLKWMHTVISNVKAFISGTFHGLDSRHLQAYLDEFCYRFNRRKFKGELFNRLIQSCVTTSTITYSELIK